MKKLYTLFSFAATISMHAASDQIRPLSLHPKIDALHKQIAHQSYNAAAEQLGSTPTGTIADFYAQLIEHGFNGVLEQEPALAAKTLAVLNEFHPEATMAEAQAAALAFEQAKKDPKNLDAWMDEFTPFSIAMMKLAQHKADRFTPHPWIAQRIAVNNNIFGTDEERTAIAAHILAVTVRFNQRFVAMNEDMEVFGAFIQRVKDSTAQLAIPAKDA